MIVNFIYLAMALAGAWIARRQPGVAFLIAFIIIRTAFFTRFVETPEPRYVLECFPAVIALAAQVFAPRASAARNSALSFFDRLGVNR